jgi:uncharacterized membrane protein YqjE
MINTPFSALLRSAVSALLAQGALHGELIRLEWTEEKFRLLRMLLALVAGTLCLFGSLLSLSAMLLIFSWGTPYQTLVLIALPACYCLGTVIAWCRFNALAALGNKAFAGSRAELGADLALIRNKLGE